MTATTARASWSTPSARLLLPADASREEWLAARRGGIGGSDAPVILGESPYQSLYGLWLDKTGRTSDVDRDTDAMRRGRWLEPHLAAWFAQETGLDVRRCGLLAHRDDPWRRATPDRLTSDGGILEIKTAGAWTDAAQAWRDGIDRRAYVQAQHYLAVTGRSHAWIVAYVDPSPILRGPVERDEELIATLVEAERRFWHEHVLADVPPPVDLATITDDEIAARWPVEVTGSTREAPYPALVERLLVERAECKAAEKAARDRIGEIDRALRVMAGDAEALTVNGRPVATFKTAHNPPRVDPALATDHPDIWARYVTRTTSRRIHIVKPRKDTQ